MVGEQVDPSTDGQGLEMLKDGGVPQSGRDQTDIDDGAEGLDFCLHAGLNS